MKNYIKPVRILFYLSLLGFHILSFGQPVNLQFQDPIKDKDFNNKSGLSIAQDSLGFIWIGTNNGLYCNYGNKLVCYKNDPTDSTSIPGNYVKYLYVDNKGKLWITTDIGLCTYNRQFDNFERVSAKSVYPDSYYVEFSAVNQDHNDNLYIAIYGSIYLYHPDTKTLSPFFVQDSLTISNFVFDEDNNLWIAAINDGGLYFYNPSENKTEKFLYDGKNENSLSNNTIRDISLGKGSQLWIGTYGGGVTLLDTKTRKFKRYNASDSYSNFVVCTYLDNQNNFWVCDMSGLKWYDRESDKFHQMETPEAGPDVFKRYPAKIMQDKQGNYWTIYTPGGAGFWIRPKGIHRYNDDTSRFWHTINNNILTIAFDKHDNYWIGNGNDGIDVFDFKNNKHRVYHSNPNNKYSLGKGAVISIYKDNNDKMWIGTNLGGLQYYDEENDRFFTYLNDPNNPNSIANNDIRGIVEDKKGNFWIITHGKGLDYFNPGEQKFYHYTNANSGLSNDWDFQLLLDSDENLWVASAWGVSFLKNGEKKFKVYSWAANDTATVSNASINCLFEDSKKRIWIGTIDGLNRYNPQTNNIVRYHSNFESQNICSIEESRNGNLWISTLVGISEFNPETGKVIHNLNKYDGLPEEIFNTRASIKNNENVLFFGTYGGLVYFNPEELIFNNQIPDVYFTGFYIDNQKITKFGEGQLLPVNIIDNPKIELNYKQSSIGFEFSSTNYINVEKNRFKYRLKGIDADWVETTSGEANYNYLPPGNYSFTIITANNDNVWNTTGTSINIIINKPWWFSWWFISIDIILLVLLIIFILRLRTTKLIREKAELERQVQLRTKDLSETNAQLKIQKEQIEQQSLKIKEDAANLAKINAELSRANATKDKLFSIVAHDLINPFNAILGFSNELSENYHRWDESQRIQFLKYINDSSKKAFDLMQNLLHWARSQNGRIEFKPVYLNVAEIINNAIEEQSTLAQKKNIELINLLKNENLKAFCDGDMIHLILRNLLMNAIKFSNSNSKVIVDAIDNEKDMVQFSVKDFGIGMDPTLSSSIFDIGKMMESTSGTSGEKGVGLGISLCKDFITRHKGEIWVESAPGKGSTFFFTIPENDNL